MKVYVCEYENCNKKFCRPSKLQAHYNLHTGVKPFKCTAVGCTKSYFTSSHLQRHLKCHEETPMKTVEYVCSNSSCQATFETLWGLQRHEDKHFSENYCEQCKRHFQTAVSYQKHLKVHDERLNQKCQHCGESFANKSKRELQQHEKKHIYVKCDICDKVFQNVNLLYRHSVVHESKFECAHCGLVLKSKSSLRMHIKSLHVGFVSPVICDHDKCTKVYHYKRNQKWHSAKHEKVNFECTMADCHRTFVHQRGYQKHIQLHKQNRIKVKKTKRPKEDVAAKLTNYVCDFVVE